MHCVPLWSIWISRGMEKPSLSLSILRGTLAFSLLSNRYEWKCSTYYYMISYDFSGTIVRIKFNNLFNLRH